MADVFELTNKLRTARRFLRALSFVPILTKTSRAVDEFAGSEFTSDRAKPCKCGKKPIFEPDDYAPGKWIAICKDCAQRTPGVNNPLVALRMWNEGTRTELSMLLRDKLTAESVDTEGVVNLLSAVKQQAVADLMSCEQTNRLDSPAAQNAREWIKDPKVIRDIESGDRRRREKKDDSDREGACDEGFNRGTDPGCCG